jgi:hypothetical protein
MNGGGRTPKQGHPFFTRSIGESRIKVNRAGVAVDEGTIEMAMVVEATTMVKRSTLETPVLYRSLLYQSPEQYGSITASDEKGKSAVKQNG